MAEPEEHGFMGMITAGLSSISRIITASVFPPMAEGTEMIMKQIEEKMLQMEKRLMRKMLSLLVIGFGAIFLVFALFFFLVDYARWSNALAFLAVGITIFVIGLLLKVGESDR